MQNQEEPLIQNWADYIDALQTFRPTWPHKHKVKLQRRALEEDPGVYQDGRDVNAGEAPES